MKYVLFAAALGFFGACSYKVSTGYNGRSKEDIKNFVEENHFATNNINEIPKRLLHALEGPCRVYTTDSAKAATNTEVYSLITRFGLSNDGKRGYIVYAPHNGKQTCVLFEILKHRLIEECVFHFPAGNSSYWKDFSPKLYSNEMLFGAGVICHLNKRKYR